MEENADRGEQVNGDGDADEDEDEDGKAAHGGAVGWKWIRLLSWDRREGSRREGADMLALMNR